MRSAAIAFSAVLLAWGAVFGQAPEPQPSTAQAEHAEAAKKPKARAHIDEKEKRSHWELSWKGWDGLHLEFWHKTRMVNPFSTFFHLPSDTPGLRALTLEEQSLSARIGGLLEFDGAVFPTTGNLPGFDDGIDLRRARIKAEGDATLLVPFQYEFDLGYVPNQFTLRKAYVIFPNIRYIGNLQVGQFQPPMGLSVTTSHWNISFMEPAAPLTAIAPGAQAGIQIGQPVFERLATWALGFFGPGAGGNEYGSVSKGFGNAVGRVTWIAAGRPNADDPSRNRFLHVGLSTNVLFASNGTIRYRARPESYVAPYVIDTGDIASNSATTIGGEIAWVNGPFSAQGEILHSWVNGSDVGAVNFGGFYGHVALMLTGESRPYDPDAGAFARIVPKRNFSFHKGQGLGALEVAFRYSETDLSSGPVRGGKLRLLMSSLNWYLQPHLAWKFEYGTGKVTDAPSEGRIRIFQARVGVDF
jgi:phosphate-selective porin OprO/OprP